ncbi:MAG: hypothetical protein ACLP0B_04860 [Steroidobacteraceae bacterium]
MFSLRLQITILLIAPWQRASAIEIAVGGGRLRQETPMERVRLAHIHQHHFDAHVRAMSDPAS